MFSGLFAQEVEWQRKIFDTFKNAVPEGKRLHAITPEDLHSVVSLFYKKNRSYLRQNVTEKELLDCVKEFFCWTEKNTFKGEPLRQYEGKYIFSLAEFDDEYSHSWPFEEGFPEDLFNMILEKSIWLDLGDKQSYLVVVEYEEDDYFRDELGHAQSNPFLGYLDSTELVDFTYNGAQFVLLSDGSGVELGNLFDGWSQFTPDNTGKTEEELLDFVAGFAERNAYEVLPAKFSDEMIRLIMNKKPNIHNIEFILHSDGEFEPEDYFEGYLRDLQEKKPEWNLDIVFDDEVDDKYDPNSVTIITITHNEYDWEVDLFFTIGHKYRDYTWRIDGIGGYDTPEELSEILSYVLQVILEVQHIEIGNGRGEDFICSPIEGEHIESIRQLFIEEKFSYMDERQNQEEVNEDEEKKVSGKDLSKYLFQGEIYNKGRLVHAVVSSYVINNPDITFDALKAVFPDSIGAMGIFTTKDNAVKILENTGRNRHYIKDNELIELSDKVIATSTQWSATTIVDFIDLVNKLGDKYTIKPTE